METNVGATSARPAVRKDGAPPTKANPPAIQPGHFKGRSDEEKFHLKDLHSLYGFGFLGSTYRAIYVPEEGADPMFISPRDAAAREANRIVKVKGEGGSNKTLHMFKEYERWSARRTYDYIRFAPNDENPRVYNLFRGWSVTAGHGDWSLLRDHMFVVICGSNQELFDWLMTWLAHIFQFPGEKKPVAVVIRGQKGTGKSILFDFIQRLMSRHFHKVADSKRALSNFNAHYETTLLLLMEEAFWAGDQAKESILKDLITSPSLAIERKGVDQYMAKNHMRVAMISNERWVVPASHDERRFAVFDCGNQHRGDIPYFEAMVDQMNTGGLQAMLHDLLAWVPANGWSALMTPPVTSGLKEQMIDSLRGLDRFIFDLLSSGVYECDLLDEGGISLSEDTSTLISMKDLRTAARDYLADQFTGQKAANYNLIERAVRDWLDAKVVTRRAQKNSVRWVEIPALSICRDHVFRTKGIEFGPPDSETAADRCQPLKQH